MFLVNSRLGLFTVARFPWHPFSRSYGVILPSSLTMVLPRVLEFSSFLPVSVCGTGAFSLDSVFSWQPGVSYFPTYFSVPITFHLIKGDLPPLHNFALRHTSISMLNLSFCVNTSLITTTSSTGISTCCPSPTLFSLSLGPDLP